MKRLDLAQLEDRHLALLAIALEKSLNATLEQWLGEIRDGQLEIWEVPSGIIGLRQEPGRLFVEFLAGKGLNAHSILDWLTFLAGPRPIEGLVTRPGLVRIYKKLGFQPLATYMRYQDGRQ